MRQVPLYTKSPRSPPARERQEREARERGKREMRERDARERGEIEKIGYEPLTLVVTGCVRPEGELFQ